MRVVLVFFCSIIYSFCFGQVSGAGDTLSTRVYDTTNVDISSKAYFPFCSNIYSLPRENCNGNYPPNCCSYSTNLRKNQKIANWGYISCYNGSMFTWHYGASLENVKQSFENIPGQLEKQGKTFSKKLIKCFLFNEETEAYILERESFEGYKSYTLTTYGTHKGYYFYLEYSSSKEIINNEDIQPVFKQILRIK